MFEVFLQDLIFWDLGFGFLVKNYAYSRLQTSGNPQVSENNINFSFDKVFSNLIRGL